MNWIFNRRAGVRRSLALVAAGLYLTIGSASAAFLGPAPYLSASDSPFNGLPFSYSYLENFEDGALNTPGATASAGWSVLTPGPLTDSVDADDGAIDGQGTAGRSYYSRFVTSSLTITFNAADLGGNLPTHAGIVWTDVGLSTPSSGAGGVRFTATDAFGVSLGNIGPFTLGDGVASGGTAEDRFFGAVSPNGISSITISMDASTDWEVDHLQYGFLNTHSVPDPGGIALLTLAAVSLAGCSRFLKRGEREQISRR